MATFTLNYIHLIQFKLGFDKIHYDLIALLLRILLCYVLI